MLADGSYDAIVFDVDEADAGALTVELTIVSGEHKGEVVAVHAEGWTGDATDLMAIPATITVVDGQPSVRFEP